jgi:hypothetical protein
VGDLVGGQVRVAGADLAGGLVLVGPVLVVERPGPPVARVDAIQVSARVPQHAHLRHRVPPVRTGDTRHTLSACGVMCESCVCVVCVVWF